MVSDHAKLQLALQDLTQREELAGALCDGLFVDPRLAQVRQRCSCDDLRTVARVLAERITDALEGTNAPPPSARPAPPVGTEPVRDGRKDAVGVAGAAPLPTEGKNEA